MKDYFMLLVWFLLVSTVVLLVLRGVFFTGAYSQASPPPKEILDMHCHTAGFGAGGSGARVSKSLRKSWKFKLYLKIFGTSEEEVSEKGDGIVMDVIVRQIAKSQFVDDAVILAMDAPYDGEGNLVEDEIEVYVPNRFVGEAVKTRKGLHFGASVHPNRLDALEELEWSKQNGAVFVKWLPNIQGIDPSEERYRDYYLKMVELDLPLLTHVGDEDSFSRTDNALGDPKLLKLPLECGVRIIAAHVASSGEREGMENIERLLEMIPDFPNLHADISTLTQANRSKYLPQVLTDERLKGRLMYGTDYPLTNTPLVTALQFPLRLTIREIVDIVLTKNSWDRDVKLKAALGCPKEVFELSRSFLKLGS
ncbi:MAG: amidohydrolase family protein [Akkermansiaceae bacterium]|nr:amidohydrolase family protein [Akkermansiaceae bacterium]